MQNIFLEKQRKRYNFWLSQIGLHYYTHTSIHRVMILQRIWYFTFQIDCGYRHHHVQNENCHFSLHPFLPVLLFSFSQTHSYCTLYSINIFHPRRFVFRFFQVLISSMKHTIGHHNEERIHHKLSKSLITCTINNTKFIVRMFATIQFRTK